MPITASATRGGRRWLHVLAAAAALTTAHPAALAAWGANLVVNSGAEAAGDGGGSFNGSFVAGSLPGWTLAGGELTAVSYNLPPSDGYPLPTDPGPADRGVNFFGGGYGTPSVGRQSVDLGFAAGAAAGRGAYFRLSGWLGGYATQGDHARLDLALRDATGATVGNAGIGPVAPGDRGDVTGMVYREAGGWLPTGVTGADLTLTMTRTGGSSNDGYADNLGFSVVQANVGLDGPTRASVGRTIRTTVVVDTPFAGRTGDELLAFGFGLDYDTSKLALVSVDLADGWDDDSGLLDSVDVAGSSFPGVGDSGQPQLTLATLSFQVLASGVTDVMVMSDVARDPNQGLLFLDGTATELLGRTTLMLTPVPEPATSGMALLGLAAIVAWRRAARRQA